MMPHYHIVTYATHSQGLFQKLADNPHNVPITVLGWGKPWYGFMDKLVAMQHFVSSLPPDDVVVFLDGFDTVINRHPKNAISRFLHMQPPTGILVSVEQSASHLHDRYNQRVFGPNYVRCRVNSGMYMGYAHSLQSFLTKVLSQSANVTDDQRAFNNCCDYVTKDTTGAIFRNLIQLNPLQPCPQSVAHLDAVFVSFPSSMGCTSPHRRLWPRLKRLVGNVPEIMIIIFVPLLLLCLAIIKSKKGHGCPANP